MKTECPKCGKVVKIVRTEPTPNHAGLGNKYEWVQLKYHTCTVPWLMVFNRVVS